MAVAHEAVHEEHKLGFIQRYIFSQDHKIIGIQYMMTSLFMAAVGGVLAMLIRMERGWPGGHWGVAPLPAAVRAAQRRSGIWTRPDAVAGEPGHPDRLVPVRLAELHHDRPADAHPRHVHGPDAARDVGAVYHRHPDAAVLPGAVRGGRDAAV